ncbi:hypothetical protein GCM10009717_29350 [Agromyces allii]|uniref:Uncharacterized protein n=2 Tax=Agromyces allii TaxID=393607 RepID=A0ABP5CAI6_9MICO
MRLTVIVVAALVVFGLLFAWGAIDAWRLIVEAGPLAPVDVSGRGGTGRGEAPAIWAAIAFTVGAVGMLLGAAGLVLVPVMRRRRDRVDG